MTKAQWSHDTGKWVLDIQPVNGEVFQDTCDVLFTAIGGLDRWKWPDIEGLHRFQGKLIHSANWNTGEGDPAKGWEDTVKNWGDKKVAVIGVGSSALQIVPSLQPRVKHLYNYVKGRTWLSATFSKDDLESLSHDPSADNCTSSKVTLSFPVLTFYPEDFFTDEEKEKFQDPVYYKKFRKQIEGSINVRHSAYPPQFSLRADR